MKAFLVLFLSLVLTAIVSCCFGFAGYLLGHSFWATTAGAFGCQCFLGWLWNISQEKKYQVAALEAIAENNLAEAYSHVELACAYCQIRNIVKIAVGKENSFTCKNCNQTNNIHIQYTTARITTPVVASPDLEEVLKTLEEQPVAANQSKVNTEQLKFSM